MGMADFYVLLTKTITTLLLYPGLGPAIPKKVKRHGGEFRSVSFLPLFMLKFSICQNSKYCPIA
jgi:hypothetical protein